MVSGVNIIMFLIPYSIMPLIPRRRQLGVVKYLAERYDLTDPRLAFLGASAGSLMVVLAACGVPAGQAHGASFNGVMLPSNNCGRDQRPEGLHCLAAVPCFRLSSGSCTPRHGDTHAVALGPADPAKVPCRPAASLVRVPNGCRLVPADDALAGAHRLALEHGIFDRPLGVAGIWGAIIRRWLDDLLPPNAVELCSGRVRLVVTEVYDRRRPAFR
jgi:hypothetical protein